MSLFLFLSFTFSFPLCPSLPPSPLSLLSCCPHRHLPLTLPWGQTLELSLALSLARRLSAMQNDLIIPSVMATAQQHSTAAAAAAVVMIAKYSNGSRTLQARGPPLPLSLSLLLYIFLFLCVMPNNLVQELLLLLVSPDKGNLHYPICI